MSLLNDLRFRFRAIFGKAALERDLDDELRFHLDMEAERLVRSGLAPDEARRRARLAFGGVEQIKDASRDTRGIGFVEHLVRDLVHSFRLARKQAGFTTVVALSLALGIGTTTAVFNLTYNILFVPLAVPHPEQLVTLERVNKDDRGNSFTWAEYRALRETAGVGAFATSRGASAVAVAAGEQREYINIHFVEGGYFPMVGVRPLRGRFIMPDDDAQRANVVLLSEQFAERLFPGDSAVVGRTITIRGAGFTVIGVMPRSYRGLEFPGWFTAAIPEGSVGSLAAAGPGRDNHGEQYGVRDARLSERRTFQVVGRLSMPIDAARRALSMTFQRCCQANAHAQESLDVMDIRRGIAGGKNDFRPQAAMVMAILLAGMALVLIVVCCNIASLLLVRASARQREIALRLSLGASRTRLASQLIMENVPHVLLGGVGGLLFAAWGTPIFIRHLPSDWLGPADGSTMFAFQMVPMLAFVAVLATMCGVAFAIYPAIRASRQELAKALRIDARSSRTRGQGTIARGVVVAQVAVTVVLVSAASLFTATLTNLDHTDGGFATDHVLLTGIEARSTPYERAGIVPIHEEVLRRVREVPGVRAAAMATLIPLFGGNSWFVDIRVPGYATAPDSTPSVPLVAITPGYFDASGIRLTSGRDFTTADHAHSESVAIVSTAFARRYFRDRNPLGRSFGVQLQGDTMTSIRIVGVVTDAKYFNLRDAPDAAIYTPLLQSTGDWANVALLLRTTDGPTRVTIAVKRAIDAAAPGIGVRRVMDMRTVRETEMAFERLAAQLAAFVSAMALALSAVGLYGLVAYTVTRRTSEIGVRLALGAQTRAILWLVGKETMTLVILGVVVGIPLSFAANGALRSKLYGVSALDPTAASISILLLTLAAVAASVIPAHRAARIDPRIALNAD